MAGKLYFEPTGKSGDVPKQSTEPIASYINQTEKSLAKWTGHAAIACYSLFLMSWTDDQIKNDTAYG